VTSDPQLSSQRSNTERGAMLVIALMSIGEALVGVVILALPREVTLLLVDAALDAKAQIVARMLGVAILALGITWWMARGDAERLSHVRPGSSSTTSVSAAFGWAALGAHPRFPGSCASRIWPPA
jgi:hypothetical protein